MSRFGRRDFLKIGALAAGAAACRGGIIRTAPIFRTGPDLTAEAATNYQDSLKALRRTGVNPASSMSRAKPGPITAWNRSGCCSAS